MKILVALITVAAPATAEEEASYQIAFYEDGEEQGSIALSRENTDVLQDALENAGLRVVDLTPDVDIDTDEPL